MMRRDSFLLLWLIVLVGLAACESKKLGRNEYLQKMSDTSSDIRSSKEIDGIVYTAQYRPLDYMVMLDHSENEFTPSQIDSIKKEYVGLQYFSLRITAKEGSGELLKQRLKSQEEYQQRLLYCMSAMKEDIKLRDGDQVYPCKMFHFVRSFDVTPHADFLVAFPRSKIEQEQLLRGEAPVYTDKQLALEDKIFGNGLIKLSIKGESITEHPILAEYAK